MTIADYIPFLADLPKESQMLILNGIALIIALIVIWLLRNIVTKIIMVPLKGLAKSSGTDIDDRALGVIERPVRILVLGMGVGIVVAIFDFSPTVNNFASSLSSALVLAAVVFFVYNLVDLIGVTPVYMYKITGLEIEPRLLPFLRTVIKVVIVVIGLLIVVEQMGADVTGLIASFGVVGLAFSLAAQDTASNVFGFTSIVGDNPFQVGDYIVSGDIAGTVEHVGVRSTRIRKLDQSLVIMPNSNLSGSAIVNWSRLSKRRFDFIIGLTYSTKADQMRNMLDRLRDMLKARELVDPESVVVRFISFGDSSLNIRIIAYILLPDWGEYTAECELINLEIMTLVEAAGLSMAFPSRSLYLETVPENTRTAEVGISKAAYSVPDGKENSDMTDADNESASNERSGDSQ